MTKSQLRIHLKKVLSEMSPQKREAASQSLFSELLPILACQNFVLSFVSFNQEIDTALINQFLARTGRLLLPKIYDKELQVYAVTQMRDFQIKSYGLLEPNPHLCQEMDTKFIEMALVPALGFDALNHRIGYGYGFYDRFLKKEPHIHTLGVGFKEQRVLSIPTEANDVPLEKVFLF